MKTDKERGEAVVKTLRAVRKTKNAIRATGFEPTWELFEKTFGWYQIKKNLSEEQQENFKRVWEEVQ